MAQEAQNKIIQWQNISEAISYYKGYGFKYIEVPWLIDSKSIGVTLPTDRAGMSTDYGFLTGSAEQSFIQMMIAGSILPGKYIAATPCFRDDPIDELHQQYFFKVELIYLSKKPIAKKHLDKMIDTSLRFYQNLRGGNNAKVIKTDIGFDIELNGIEIGSYGHRKYDKWNWVYGTGYADPRFTIAASKVLNEKI